MTRQSYGECPVCGVDSDFDDVMKNDQCCPTCGYDPDEWDAEPGEQTP